MIRRIFTLVEGNEHGLTPGQYLVTIDLGSKEVHFAYRPEVWDAWSRPLEQTAVEDDPPADPGARSYGGDGRAYDPNLDMARLGVSLATGDADSAAWAATVPEPAPAMCTCGQAEVPAGETWVKVGRWAHRTDGPCHRMITDDPQA